MTFHDHRTPLPAAVPPAARGLPGPVTLALRAMRETVAQPIGPVTEAIRTMRAAMPDFDADPDLRALRRALADRIEADMAALDMLGGDPDAEPSLGSAEPVAAVYMLTGPDGQGYYPGDQTRWASGSRDDCEEDAGDDREEENEHGGDIQDEPHDREEDCDPDAIIDAGTPRRYRGADTRMRELVSEARAGACAVLAAHIARGAA